MSLQRTNFKVLVADDHFLARQIVSTVLQKNNITNITTVADGKAAMSAIYAAHESKSPFHIVFLDWEMPAVSGLDVLIHFRQQKEFVRTAFIMLTAVTQQSEVLQAVKAGVTAYISKPVTYAGIEAKFLEVCEWVRKNEGKGT